MIRDLLETLSRLVAVFRRRTLDRDFDEEFSAHLDLLIARNEERGLPRDEARRQAILQLGGLNGTKNLHREARGLPRLDRLLEEVSGFRRDLVHAARALAKAPGFAFVCVTSLSIGMGLVIAIPYVAQHEFKAASVEPYFAIGSLERSELTMLQAAFFAVTGMVLLIVCLNVSGMMQARSAIRERELAVRLAIGASRGRLVQYLLSEAVMLAGIAGTLAVIVLFGVPQAIFWRFGHSLPPHVQEHIWQVLRPTLATSALAVGLCFATSLVFGLLPALRFSRPSLVSALKDEPAAVDDESAASIDSPPRHRWRSPCPFWSSAAR